MFYMKTEKFLVPVQIRETLSKGKNQLMALSCRRKKQGRERRRKRGKGINELPSGPAVNLKWEKDVSFIPMPCFVYLGNRGNSSTLAYLVFMFLPYVSPHSVFTH